MNRHGKTHLSETLLAELCGGKVPVLVLDGKPGWDVTYPGALQGELVTDLVVWMAKGSEGGSGAHESGSSSDGKGKGGYTGKHEAAVKPAPAPAKGGGKK